MTKYVAELGFVEDFGSHGTWSTDYIEVEAKNETEAEKKAIKEAWSWENLGDSVIHIFVYHIETKEEADDWWPLEEDSL